MGIIILDYTFAITGIAILCTIGAIVAIDFALIASAIFLATAIAIPAIVSISTVDITALGTGNFTGAIALSTGDLAGSITTATFNLTVATAIVARFSAGIECNVPCFRIAFAKIKINGLHINGIAVIVIGFKYAHEDSTICQVFLQSGYPAHPKNSPLVPLRGIIGRPHLSHFPCDGM
jgi:hypothetical protein